MSEEETEKYWGYHLSLDCYDGDKDAVKDRGLIEEFTRKLVKDIDMVAYGDPQIVHFGEGDKEGFTLIQLIETSNICAHFVNDTGNIYLDVFSCKEFDPDVVESLVRSHFRSQLIIKRCIARK